MRLDEGVHTNRANSTEPAMARVRASPDRPWPGLAGRLTCRLTCPACPSAVRADIRYDPATATEWGQGPVSRRTADREATLSAPIEALAAQATATLGLTVLWHPRRRRIGEQAALLLERGAAELNRNAPAFFAAASDVGEALEHQGVSRQSLCFRAGDDGSVLLSAPASTMRVEIDGVPISEDMRGTPIAFDTTRLRRGVVLRLGGSVLLCLGYIGIGSAGQGGSALVGVSPAMTRVRAAIAQVAATDMPTLILGETGTGKELVAQAIHAASARSHRMLVSVNMAALNESLAAADLFGANKGAYTGAQVAREGYFAEANGGTLFLDEIGDTPAAVQPMLLRALETGEYRPLGSARNERADVRLIAATDRDLSTPGFNQPLLRRLEAFVIAMPPLRERRQDIGVLIVQLLQRWQGSDAAPVELPGSVVQALCLYDWPGNVRQLAHVLRRLSLAAQVQEWPDMQALLPAPVPAPVSLSAPAMNAGQVAAVAPAVRYRSPSRVREDDVIAALEAHQWCVRKAAEHLCVSRASFYVLLDASPSIRRADDIPLEEISRAVAQAPDDPGHWASQLRTPRESLRRRVRQLGLAKRL